MCIHTCMCIHTHIHSHLYTYTYTYTHTHIHIYIYIKFTKKKNFRHKIINSLNYIVFKEDNDVNILNIIYFNKVLKYFL